MTEKVFLEDCPFCHCRGSELEMAHVGCYYVQCLACEADGPTGDTEEEAAAKWNAAAKVPPAASGSRMVDAIPDPECLEKVFKADKAISCFAWAALRYAVLPAGVSRREFLEEAGKAGILTGPGRLEWEKLRRMELGKDGE
jgi:hypothetical protein